MIKRNKRLARIKSITRDDLVQRDIKKFLKAQGCIVYGARSINAQAGILKRNTQDWDAYSKNPKQTAKALQRQLDKTVGGNNYFHKEAMHKGTWKVKGVGDDLIPNTMDDVEVADFSKNEKRAGFVTIGGMKYRKLKHEIKAKKTAVADPEFKFRHRKDQTDLDRIKDNLKIKRIMGFK